MKRLGDEGHLTFEESAQLFSKVVVPFNSHQQCVRILTALCPHQHLACYVLLNVGVAFSLSDPWWALLHVLICHLYSWLKCVLIIIELFLFLFLNVEHFMFILPQVPVKSRIGKYFLPVSGLSSFSLNHGFQRADVHIFMKSPYWFFFQGYCF